MRSEDDCELFRPGAGRGACLGAANAGRTGNECRTSCRSVGNCHVCDAPAQHSQGEECMARLVIVSNRVPPPRARSDLAGGLAVALREAIAQYETLWFGWSGQITDQP